MSDVLVSFVVPAFNEEVLIASCLYSILSEISRTRCPAEIIVVNNNSTDSTGRIASSIPGVMVVDEPERGLVQARRAGCLAARGKLIANIDADTILPPGWLDVALAEFERRPRLVALSGPFIHYDAPKTGSADGRRILPAGAPRLPSGQNGDRKRLDDARGQFHRLQDRSGVDRCLQPSIPLLRRGYRDRSPARQGWGRQILVFASGIFIR